MRRLLTILLLGALTLNLTAQSQKRLPKPVPDSYMANHLALGLSVGTDAISADLALPLTKNFTVRAGYGTMAILPFAKYSTSVRVDSENPWKIHDNIAGTAKPKMDNLHLLVDLYPGKNTVFHFSLGAYYMLNAHGFIQVRTDNPLPIPANEFCVTGVEVKTGGKTSYVTTDDKGYMRADVRFGLGRVLPYAGIGFGRAVSDGRVRFLFDLGALYTRSLEVYSYDYGIKGSMESPRDVALTTELIPADYAQTADIVRRVQKIPVYPILKFSLFVKLF